MDATARYEFSLDGILADFFNPGILRGKEGGTEGQQNE